VFTIKYVVIFAHLITVFNLAHPFVLGKGLLFKQELFEKKKTLTPDRLFGMGLKFNKSFTEGKTNRVTLEVKGIFLKMSC